MNGSTSLRWSIALVGLYLVVVPLVALGAPGLGGHDLARLCQIALGSLCAVGCLGAAPRGGLPCAVSQARVVAVILLGLMLASVLHADEPAMAMREVTLLFGAGMIAAVVAAEASANVDLGFLSSVASAAYAAVVMLLIAAVLLGGLPMERTDLFIGYDNHRLFNHVQTVALPMALASTCAAELPRAVRRIAAFALVAGCALLFASAGRGTFVALVVGALAVWALVGHRAGSVVLRLALAMLSGLVIFAVLFLVVPWFAGTVDPSLSDYAPGRLASDQSRGYLWRVAWEQIVSSPWLGIGPLHAAHWPNLKAAHPHNIYLQLAAEWGVPMLVAAVAAGGALIHRMVRVIRAGAEPSSVGTALTIGLVAVAIDGLVSGNFVMPVSQVWIAVLVGWSLAWARGASSPTLSVPLATKTSRRTVHGLASAALLMHLWLAWDIAPEARNLESYLEHARQAFPSERTQPRFWSHGRF